MAKSIARKPRPKNDPVDPTDHAHNPDTENSAHPAAAPLGTDEEAGRRAPRPVKTDRRSNVIAVNSQGEVRAGPGDAGMQKVPRVLNDPQDKSKRRGTGLMLPLLIAGPFLVLLIWYFSA